MNAIHFEIAFEITSQNFCLCLNLLLAISLLLR